MTKNIFSVKTNLFYLSLLVTFILIGSSLPYFVEATSEIFDFINGFSRDCLTSCPPPSCDSHSSKACFEGNVYWYDSCGDRQEIAEDCGDSGWTGSYQCSANLLKREWIERGCQDAVCFANSEWRTYQDCGSDSWADEYQCSGGWLQRKKYVKSCEGSSCSSYSQWENYQNCSAADQICQNNQCVYPAPSCTNECSFSGESRCYDYYYRQVCGNYDSDSCLEWSSLQNCSGSTSCGYGRCSNSQRPYWYCSAGSCDYNCNYDSNCDYWNGQDYLACYNNDVYWFDSWGGRQGRYQDCGEDYCESWGTDYCYNSDVYRRETCYRRGCSNSSCYSNAYIKSDLISDCGVNKTCQDGRCINLNVCSFGSCCENGQYKPSSSTCNGEVQTEYSCPWGLACGSDVGKRIRTRFQYCSGNSFQCIGRWGDWLPWTSWLVADYCGVSEVCSSGISQCQLSSACLQPTQPTQATSSYIKNYRKDCSEGDLYWFDANGERQDKYQECSDDNNCTIDGCKNRSCFNEPACEESGCEKGSADYCKICQHCEDSSCNCEETICSCSGDCKIEDLVAAKLKEQQSGGSSEKGEKGWLAAISENLKNLFQGGTWVISSIVLFILFFSAWYFFTWARKREA